MRQLKKTKRADIRRWSPIFFLIGLNIMVWSAAYALDFKTLFYNELNKNEVVAANELGGKNQDESDEIFKVQTIDAEDIENLVNTIAYTHAVWPGYKGDITNGREVRKHFSKNLATVIIKSGGLEIINPVRVHFYYVVRDDGGIQFLALKEGGKSSKNLNERYIKKVQEVMSIGIPGIKAGTDDKGEPITVVYELLITFVPASN